MHQWVCVKLYIKQQSPLRGLPLTRSASFERLPRVLHMTSVFRWNTVSRCWFTIFYDLLSNDTLLLSHNALSSACFCHCCLERVNRLTSVHNPAAPKLALFRSVIFVVKHPLFYYLSLLFLVVTQTLAAVNHAPIDCAVSLFRCRKSWSH